MLFASTTQGTVLGGFTFLFYFRDLGLKTSTVILTIVYVLLGVLGVEADYIQVSVPNFMGGKNWHSPSEMGDVIFLHRSSLDQKKN